MNWDDLKFFLAVAKSRSIRGAADRLKVSHSTVSRRIDALEDGLGVRLFDRLPSGYVATITGEELLKVGGQVAATIDDVERRVLGRDTQLAGEVRVTMPNHLAYCLLMPDLERFSREYPEIEIELIVSYERFDLVKREADIALRITHSPPDHLIGRKVAAYATGVYATPQYLASHDLEHAPEDACWIGWNDTQPFPEWVRNSAFPKTPAKGRINDAVMQLVATKSNLGIGMLPCFMADQENALVRVVPETSKPRHDVWLLSHPDLRETARIRTFSRFITTALKAKRDLLEGRRTAKSSHEPNPAIP